MASILYMDASAVAKLCLDEPESGALETRIRGCRLVSSAIAPIEVTRAARRVTDDDVCGEVLAAVGLLQLDPQTVGLASTLAPATLRTLDAIHLASALRLAGDLEAFVTYDRQLGAAAAAAGLPVESPR